MTPKPSKPVNRAQRRARKAGGMHPTELLQFNADAFLAHLWALDDELVAHGFHPLSPWWRAELTRFIRALAAGQHACAGAMVRAWIVRAGRRAGKSSALCR